MWYVRAFSVAVKGASCITSVLDLHRVRDGLVLQLVCPTGLIDQEQDQQVVSYGVERLPIQGVGNLSYSHALAALQVKEIIYPLGATIDIRQVALGDQTMSVLEIWGAEYQENDCLLIKPDDRPLLEAIAARERCIMQVQSTPRLTPRC